MDGLRWNTMLHEYEELMYDFNVSIWYADGRWLYSLIQEFDEGARVELLAYGDCDTLAQAAHCVSTEMKAVQFD